MKVNFYFCVFFTVDLRHYVTSIHTTWRVSKVCVTHTMVWTYE